MILARYLQEKPPPEFVDRKFPVSSHEGQARFEASDLTMSDSVDRVFVHALNTVKRIPRTGTARPPAAERLKLYGLYKQSMGRRFFDTGMIRLCVSGIKYAD